MAGRKFKLSEVELTEAIEATLQSQRDWFSGRRALKADHRWIGLACLPCGGDSFTCHEVTLSHGSGAVVVTCQECGRMTEYRSQGLSALDWLLCVEAWQDTNNRLALRALLLPS